MRILQRKRAVCCALARCAPITLACARSLPADRDECPQLYETITQHMLHGPCGAAFPNAPCMEGGECTKHYPREWQDDTTLPQDGYPLYRRRNDGRTFQK